ncbi:MAG: hypothetical protein MI749_03285 [Desulfovibrionales bacterium]|nr:hypothetical protein [Desulfovibrionales bacterium]
MFSFLTADFKINRLAVFLVPVLVAALLPWQDLCAQDPLVRYKGKVAAFRLNLRSAPTRNSRVIAILEKGQVVDVLDAGHDGEGAPWFFEHGLHPFHPRYFTQDSPVFSYSQRQFDLAGLREHVLPEVASTLSWGDNDLPDGLETVALDDFINFFRAPGRTYMERVLGIGLPEIQAPDLDREPFKLGGLGHYKLGQDFLMDYLESTGDARTLAAGELPRARAGGKLPFGEQGRLSWETLVRQALPIRDRVQNLLGEGMIPANQSIDLVVGNLRIMGQTRDLLRRGSGKFFFCTPGFSRLGAGRFLVAWIRHLVVSRSLGTRGELSTLVVGRDVDEKGRAKGGHFFTPDTGALEDLATLYRRGTHGFLPFFPNSCFALAKVLAAKDWDCNGENLKKARASAAKVWDSSKYVVGEGEDPYLSLYLTSPGGAPIRPFGDPLAFENMGILELSQTIYKPLLENLKDMEK